MKQISKTKFQTNIFRLLFATILIGVFVFGYVLYSSLKLDKSQVALASENQNELITSSGYIDYKGQNLRANPNQKVVLLFKANWCSTCVDLEKDINKNLDKIPKNLTIIKIDFDREFELRKKYQINLQHTLVQINEEGKAIEVTYLTPTLEKLIQNLK